MTLKGLSTRRWRLVLLTLGCALLLHFSWRIYLFIHMFYGHSGLLLDQQTVADAYTVTLKGRQQPVVPRVIHQIFHNWTHPEDSTLPSDWAAIRQTCLDLHPDWEHMLWTSNMSSDFIATEYPWFSKTYASYPFPVQRIDALRYFLMRRYGGFYIDLDNGCTADLQPLRYYSIWVTDGGCGALSNNILGAVPDHPYWHLVTNNLKSYAWNYGSPYITISFAAGQWFLTAMWDQYHRDLPATGSPLTRISMDLQPGAPSWIFFFQGRGGTWDNWDNRLFKWIGDHLVVFAAMILLITVCVAAFLGAIVRGATRYKTARYKQYHVVIP